MSYNEELWDDLAAMRRELATLKRKVAALEGQLPDLQAEHSARRTFNTLPHEVTKCASCGEKHDCALLKRGPVAMGRPVETQLVANCEACYISTQQRAAWSGGGK
jgi:hypothetical protein